MIAHSLYIGVDFHVRKQWVAWCDMESGECGDQEIIHDSPELDDFYHRFEGRDVLVGFEASGIGLWFERYLKGLGYTLLHGDAAEIRRRARRRQKTDKRDAVLILDLLMQDEFPAVWRPSPENVEVMGVLRLRHKMVKARTIFKNILQAQAANERLKGSKRKYGAALANRMKALDMSASWNLRRDVAMDLIGGLNEGIERLERRLEEYARKDERVLRLMSHPGIGFLTGLALVHKLGDPTRFATSRKVAAYVGLDPVESSTGDRRRIGGISKQGSALLRFLLVEGAHHARKKDPDLKALYHRLVYRRNRNKARVAVARRVLIRCWIMWRDQIDYDEFRRRGRSAPSLVSNQTDL